MDESPVSNLVELGKRFKGRITPITLLDSNVCKSEFIADRPWEYVVVSGEPFSKRLRYSHGGRKITAVANNFFLHLSVAASLPIGLLTINEKNLIRPRSKEASTISIGEKKYPVFTDTGDLSPDQRQFLAIPILTDLLQVLALESGEKLNFSSEDISVYLKKPTLEKVMRSAERMVDIAKQTEVPEENGDLTVVPSQFHPLIPLIKKWAIGDDSKRISFIEDAPTTVLENFVASVEPYLPAINSYLDSFGTNPPSFEAALLGRLAECAIEAKHDLRTRRERR